MPKLSALTAKAAPTTADELVITDKADSNNTKRITINNLPLSAAAVSGLAAKAPTASPTFTGVISIPDGSAAAPSLSNTGDSNTGLYWSAADELSVATGGVQRAVVDSSGNLGVGASSPNSNVHVHSSSNISRIQITNNNCGSSASDGSTITSVDNELQIINQEGGYISLGTNNTTRATIDFSGNLLVGKTSLSIPTIGHEIRGSGQMVSTVDSSSVLIANRKGSDGVLFELKHDDTTEGSIGISGSQLLVNGNHFLGLQTGGTTRATIDSSGNLLVGKTAVGASAVGFEARSDGECLSTRFNGIPLNINRTGSDGSLISFQQDSTTEGSISVSGTTVSYNGGHLARWSRMLDGSKPENLLKGTVMTNLDEMIEWAYDETPEVLWAAGDGLPEGVSVGDVKVEGKEATYWGELGEAVPGFAGDVKLGDVKSEAVEEVLWTETDGLPEGVQIGDVKVEYKAAGVEDNEQLNHTAISSVEGDRDVAGVFIAWDDDDEYNDYHLAMVGDVIIRIAEGVEVKRGDLLVSAGDGTAKPQDDDIQRSSTIAKVTSKNVTCIYDDGSFCVPCVLK